MSDFLASNAGFFALGEMAFDGMAAWEANPWRVVWANPAFWRLLGGDRQENAAVGSRPTINQELIELLERFDSGPTATTSEHQLEALTGERVRIRLCRLPQTGRTLVGMTVGALNESSAPANGSRRDPVTGLPDRESLMQGLAALLGGSRAADRQFAVLFLDLDNFKQVNDEFGHLVGDRILREVAQRIACCVREGDLLVRFGGDEFVALIHGVTTADEVEPVVERIRTALKNPIPFGADEVTLTLSAGVALASAEHRSPDELLAAADRAMYAAKHRS
jgi:diguanylate cyclase (GGDEF)-like protein